MPKQKKSGRTGNIYALTASGAKHLADVKGQGAIIRDALSKRPSTAAELLQRVGKLLKTKNAKGNIAFYLSAYKADGFLKFLKAKA